MKTAIVGINWGDEGKGRMVDLISSSYQVVVRYQGGNNAGHTVINERGKFVLNLLPSGVLRRYTVNVMGNGMLIDIEHLCGEMQHLREAGIELEPGRLLISDKAVICMPYHKQLDCLEEDRLANARFGSTRRGISPGYADKYMKKSLRMEDLLNPELLPERVAAIAEWKNLTLSGYDAATDTQELLDWLKRYGEPLIPYICDTTKYLNKVIADEEDVLFEAQLGALRDVDFGIYPYTTASNTIAAYAPIGAGVPAQKLDKVIGVIKAYSSCVGEGPFTAELFGEEGDKLREAGAEYGAATGRPRRVGMFDMVASRYGVQMQGANCLALTKLDVLRGMPQLPVCTDYEIDGRLTQEFPSGADLIKAKPRCKYLPGFDEDISGCRTFESLPAAARDYVLFLQQRLDCPIRFISVGAERDQIIIL